MSDLLVGALAVLLSTNQPAAPSNLVVPPTGITVAVPGTNDPVEQELQKLLAADDAAQEAVEKLVNEADQPADPLVAPTPLTLRARLDEKLKPVRVGYEDFLERHPRHARGWMAYASFLHDIGDEKAAIERYEKAREIDPKDPATWNNLANIYAHIGPVEKAFPYYDEAIRIKPDEPLYLHNFGTLVFLFRKDATNYFKCDEQEVFNRALALYDRALKLDPKNFPLASDVAQTYYGFKPPPTKTPEEARLAELHLADQALTSWTNALSIAGDGVEREGVYLHFARWNIRVGRFAEARTNLSTVTNAMYAQVKQRLERNLAEKDPVATAKP